MRDYGNTNAAPYASAPALGLAGDTYWNTTTKILYVSDGTAWIAAGPGAGGPPSGPAGGDLGAPGSTYPNPTITDAAKSKWSVSGATITPTDAAKMVACAPVGLPLSWGPTAVKHYLGDASGGLQMQTNFGSAINDTSKSQWVLAMSAPSDQFQLIRSPAGATAAWATLMSLNANGGLGLPGSSAFHPELTLGSRTVKARVLADRTLDILRLSVNQDLNAAENAWVQDDATKPSWNMHLYSGGDQFAIARSPAGGSSGALFYIQGSDGKTYCTLGNNQITQAMLAPQCAIAGSWAVALPASWNSSVSGTWVQVCVVNVSLVAGRYHLIIANPGWAVYGAMNASHTFYVGYGFDGGVYTYSRFDTASNAGIGNIPGPTSLVWLEGGRPTGAHTYSLWVWRDASLAIQTQADAPGALQVIEFS
jgi:hypothetical protein